jgi:hypothetical protein
MGHTGTPENELAKYLKERLKRIEDCYRDIENKVMDDETTLMHGVDTITEMEFSTAYRHINFSIRNTFRYVMLVAVCSFVEEALVRIAKQLDRDYSAHIQESDRTNRAKAHLDLLSEHAGLELKPIAPQLPVFKNMIILRNCVVHAWGNVAEDRNRVQVREAVAGLTEAAAKGNQDFVRITEDDYLYFGDHIVVEAILKAESIINHVLKSLLGQPIVRW